jgi:hypothetical protein
MSPCQNGGGAKREVLIFRRASLCTHFLALNSEGQLPTRQIVVGSSLISNVYQRVKPQNQNFQIYDLHSKSITTSRNAARDRYEPALRPAFLIAVHKLSIALSIQPRPKRASTMKCTFFRSAIYTVCRIHTCVDKLVLEEGLRYFLVPDRELF